MASSKTFKCVVSYHVVGGIPCLNKVSGVGLVNPTCTGASHRDNHLGVCWQSCVFGAVIDLGNLRHIGGQKGSDGRLCVIRRLSPINEICYATCIDTVAGITKIRGGGTVISRTNIINIRLLGTDQTSKTKQGESQRINQ